jgi:hypothetical protein
MHLWRIVTKCINSICMAGLSGGCGYNPVVFGFTKLVINCGVLSCNQDIELSTEPCLYLSMFESSRYGNFESVFPLVDGGRVREDAIDSVYSEEFQVGI